MPLQVINPLQFPNWDELVDMHQACSFFHTSAWARVVSESYAYKPLYFVQMQDDQITSLIPVMEVKSAFTGCRGVSLPFTDRCTVVAPDRSIFKEIMAKIIEFGKKAHWKYIEFRGGKKYFQGITPSSSYKTHTLELRQDEKELLSSFRSSTKRNIKKATREHVDVDICTSLQSVHEYYKLHCQTRKRHDLPPQPFEFFKKVYDHIISHEKGFVVLASHRKKYVAGAIFFHFGEEAIFKFGAFDRNYGHLRPNNLVMWKAIQFYARTGFNTFNFGRTEPTNTGLLQFKEGWGTNVDVMNYYTYDLKKADFVTNNRKKPYGLFKHLPLPVLKLAGSVLYRHFG